MTRVPAPEIEIVRARQSDASLFAHLINDAVCELGFARYLEPDEDFRTLVLPQYFKCLVEDAFVHGTVLTTPGREAVAVWMPHTGARRLPDPDPRYAAFLPDDKAQRLHAFDRQMASDRLDAAHHYMAILAVDRAFRHCGFGSTILDHHLEFLDRSGQSACTHATGEELVHHLRRRGFEPDGGITFPDGTQMARMVRGPRPPTLL